jgi:hypothetical protein
MSSTKEFCIICAWRENCQKKFSVSGKDIRCADFVRDVSIKDDKIIGEKSEEEKKE